MSGSLRRGTLPVRCRYDLDNLYSADGAPMPTSSGYNPTPTLQALAMRTAGAIVDPARPEAVIERDQPN